MAETISRDEFFTCFGDLIGRLNETPAWAAELTASVDRLAGLIEAGGGPARRPALPASEADAFADLIRECRESGRPVSQTDVGRRLGIRRETVSRRGKREPAFAAALEELASAHLAEAAARLDARGGSAHSAHT